MPIRLGSPTKPSIRVKPKAGAKPKMESLEELKGAQGYLEGLIAKLLRRGPRKAVKGKGRSRRRKAHASREGV